MVVFMRRRQLAMAAAGVLAALALLLIVPGCQRGGGKTEPVKAADNAARVAYLEGLGWQVTPEPLETLSLLAGGPVRPYGVHSAAKGSGAAL